MAIQLGTVDGLVNITEKSIKCFIQSIDQFSQEGREFALSNHISIGAAFQRYTMPVYKGTDAEFKKENILIPVWTNSGKEQSPAMLTYCKKMGLVNCIDDGSVFELTPIAQALLQEEITLQEYAFILLSKQTCFKEKVAVKNLLVLIASIFATSPTISDSIIRQTTNTHFGDEEIVKTRIDIILNALALTGLTQKVSNENYVPADLGASKVFSDILVHDNYVKLGLHDEDKNYANYIGSLSGGVFDYLTAQNSDIYLQFFPNLSKYMINSISNSELTNQPHQQIYYGAPGTGKSHEIKKTTDTMPIENVFRTTFHPDSDYSTFVGCYKPTMASHERLYNQGELISKLTEIKKSGVTYPVHKFSAKYWESLKELTNDEIKAILTACGFTDSMNVEVGKGIAIGQELAGHSENKKITYEFVPQAFLKAYKRAYETDESVVLVIEEINRGNCAQIFGDLFQLLDRKNGVSEYPIDADEDLRKYLIGTLGEDSPAIANGKLCLPSNLYIWATMNTSDQSLFPIDSAFKRRWDWEYMPIKYSKSAWLIDIAGVKYPWVEFQKVINGKIFDATESEDKQLGDYFVKANANDIISAKLLLNKVIFYLWNDVCKDGDGDIFKINTDLDYSKELDHSKDEDITFSQFFQGTDLKLQQWMRYLGIEPIQSVDDSNKEEEERQAQIEAGTDEKDAQKVKYSKPIYKAIIENMISKLEGQTLAFFPNGFDWAFTDMPKSYTRTTLTLDSNANTAYVKLWIPAASGYSNSRECFEYLKEHNGEAIIKDIAEKNGLQIEELGIKSSNPKPVLGWSMKLSMTFTEENTSANAKQLLQLMTDVRSAFDSIITDFQKK